jgi:hypothetical protein
VRDENRPLQGVSVVIKGSQAGTQTDAKGISIYRLQERIPLYSPMQGMPWQELPVANRTSLSIGMILDAKSLDGCGSRLWI